MNVDYIKHGDSEELMKELADESIDLTVTSPPYDELRTYEGTCEWDFDKFKQIADGLHPIGACHNGLDYETSGFYGMAMYVMDKEDEYVW